MPAKHHPSLFTLPSKLRPRIYELVLADIIATALSASLLAEIEPPITAVLLALQQTSRTIRNETQPLFEDTLIRAIADINEEFSRLKDIGTLWSKSRAKTISREEERRATERLARDIGWPMCMRWRLEQVKDAVVMVRAG